MIEYSTTGSLISLYLIFEYFVTFPIIFSLHLFYGEGCPHCEELKNYLNSLDNKEKSYFNIYTFEVWNNSTNQQFMKDSAKSLNKEVSGVPFLIIGNKTFEGYNESMNIKIKKAIKTEYKLNGKNDYYKEYKSAK